MKELNRTDRLTIASIIAVAIIVIGFITFKTPDILFNRTIEQSIPLIQSGQDIIFPEDVAVLVSTEDKGFLLIDVRSPLEYQKAHIDKARNIPLHDLLEKKNIKLLEDQAEDSVTVILYGQDQLQANSAWMLLKQIGYDNIKVMPGGYDYYSNSSLDMYDLPAIPEYMVEEPRYDYWKVLDSLGQGQPAGNININIGEPVQVIKREKKSAAEGGC